MARHFFVAILAIAGLAGISRRAEASGKQEQQLAQALFEEARALMDRQQYGEACPKFAESQRLDPGGGTLLNLALCHEKEGKLATAKIEYADALASAIKDGRSDREAFAREHLSAIEPRVPRIVVVAGPNAGLDGLEIRLDGLEIRPEAWDVAMPVDPGGHTVQAIAPGHAAWTSTPTLGPSEKKTVEVPALEPLSELPKGDDCKAPGGCGGGLGTFHGTEIDASTPTPPAASPTSPPPGFTTLSTKKTNPVFVASVYTATIAGGVSAVSGLVALIAHLRAKSGGCLPDRSYCADADAAGSADTATTYAWVSTIALGVAAAATITALVVPTHKATSQARTSPTLTLGAGGIGLSGSF